MPHPKRAFTLIELLVVIAIIAILAAILFPVFAQAKEAAKKTAALTQAKQIGTGLSIYLTDSEDTYPIAFSRHQNGFWRYNGWSPTPVGAIGNGWDTAPYNDQAGSTWANSLQPYIKNWAIYDIPGHIKSQLSDEVFIPNTTPARVSLTMNGLFHTLNASTVQSPSVPPILWAGTGNISMTGRSFANPTLRCPVAADCRFNPSGLPQSGMTGEWGSTTYWFDDVNPGYRVWSIAKGSSFVRADTSAKFQRVGLKETSQESEDWDGRYADPYRMVWNGSLGGHNFSVWGCNTGEGYDSAQTIAWYHCFFRPDRVR